MRPKRGAKSSDQEFNDPLSNYDGPDYADELERTIAEESVSVMQTTPFDTITPDTTIKAAMEHMAERNIASLIIADSDGRLAGIFSERDVLTKVADEYASIKDEPVSSVMTPQPMSVYVTDSPGKAMNLMATMSIRHVPILDVDDKVVGVLGPRRVTTFLKGHLS
jgi:CBS domain-containing protein